MAFIKRKLKQILIGRQHKIYEKEVADKNLSYDRWIREQEKNVGIEDIFSDKITKKLTNGSRMDKYGRSKNKNDGKDAEFGRKCRMVEAAGQKMLLVNYKIFLKMSQRFWMSLCRTLFCFIFTRGRLAGLPLD